MGTELFGCRVEDENLEVPSIPPGFESLVPFTLRRAETNLVNAFSMSAGPSEAQSVPMETDPESNDKTSKPLRRRSGVKYNQFDSSSDDESECEQDMILKNQLPKGVIRGCEGCNNCQKVTAKWRPNESCRSDLEEAPVFYPSEEEFEDTLKYISSIRATAELYGICRIVPPPSWKPPCPLKEKDAWERSRFTTRVQRIDKLQNRHSMRKILQINSEKRQKKKRRLKSEVDIGNGVQDMGITGGVELYEAERFGFEAGPDFSLDTFQKYADDFKTQYFRRNDAGLNLEGGTSLLEEQRQPSVEEIEGEYWRMVEEPTEEIEVLYGADLETGSFGSGFPKNSQQVSSADDAKYIQSGWNLNNFPRLPGSVLSFESSDISGVLVPWLYVGMCFSSFCWHVEDHHLYSLNYMHWGAPKMWYGVSGLDALKLEAAMRKHLPDLFEEQPDLLHKLVTQMSPSILRSEGVPVYRCLQNPGEFVLTFPRAYHAGFNCGFNCAEAVNVAPIDWLPHGQKAIELYREQGRQTSISHDKLLLGAAREAVKANWEYNLLRKHTPNNLRWKEVCGKEGILSMAFKARVEMERMRREMLCKSSQALKMESSFDANSERECSVCLFDLHLSAAGCHHCSPDKYACLNHARQLCSCSWGAKFFLFRYDINELNLLVEALEGKLSAVYRWAKFDLGLALSSYVSKEKQVPGLASKSPHPSHGVVPKDTTLVPKEMTPAHNIVPAKGEGDGGILNSTKHVGSHHSSMLKAPVVVLALENVKPPLNSGSQKGESTKHNVQSKKESFVDPRYRTSSCQVSEVNILKKAPSLQNSAPLKCEEKPSSYPDNKDVILLSDDEGDKPGKESPVEKGISGKPLVSTENPISTSVPKQVIPDNPAMEGNNLVSTTVNTDPSEMLEKASRSVFIKVEDISETQRHGGGPLSSCIKLTDKKESPEENVDCGTKQLTVYEKPKAEDNHKEWDLESRSVDNIPTAPTFSSHSNNLDRYYRQKGPRIAKVVRRINCIVEPLDFGTVHAGKLWCDSRAIYPKGFRSRVKYIDVLDPTNMCYYVSEILDAGRDGPLFMVSVEHCPSEVFIHTSATRCWEMVRDRVNHEIAKHHKLGRAKLPPLQPPGSLDGLEMFGFSSPAIVQAIQAMDQSRICTEYWKSRPLMQIPEQSPSAGLNLKSEPMSNQDTWKSNPGVERILNGLFKKADEEELSTLYTLLYSNKSLTQEHSLLTSLLNEEINKHHPR